MSQEQARIDIMTVVARIQQDFLEYPLEVDKFNDCVIDQATQTNPYLKVEIDFLPGGGQLDLGQHPMARQYGQLCLYAVVRKDAGESAARRLLDFVAPYFNCQQKGIVHFHAAEAVRGKDVAGWVHFPVWLDFWYDYLVLKK